MFIARRKRLQPNQHFQHLVNSATAMFSLADVCYKFEMEVWVSSEMYALQRALLTLKT